MEAWALLSEDRFQFRWSEAFEKGADEGGAVGGVFERAAAYPPATATTSAALLATCCARDTTR